MVQPYRTQCPHCRAQFHVGEEQLRQAGGAVRCGRCLQVFQASPLPPPVAATVTAAPETAPSPWADLDLDADTASPATKPSAAVAPVPAPSTLELSDSFLSLDEGPDPARLDDDFSTMQGAGRANQDTGADEAWAEALLAELTDPDAATAPAPPSAPTPPPPTPSREEPPDDSLGGLFADGPMVAAPPARPVLDAPDFRRPPLALGAGLRWGLLCLLAVLALVGQVFYFQFDSLARHPTWRPLYAWACQWSGCTLPSPSDLRRLRGANLVVRAHPSDPDALLVDALLFNHADYRQPFPVIELVFSNDAGEPVAGRRFLPSEYLRGDLEGLSDMPMDVPIRISLELQSPGPGADHYRMQFLPLPPAS